VESRLSLFSKYSSSLGATFFQKDILNPKIGVVLDMFLFPKAENNDSWFLFICLFYDLG
jgi:hypothetical protein